AAARTVAVDTGHTPQRPGARGPGGGEEYRFNLALSTRLAEQLASRGYTVLRIAADGQPIELKERTAKAAGADLFVSIHHDSIQQAWIDEGRRREFSGYAVFVSGKNPDLPSSLRCAKRIGEQLGAAGEHASLYHATPITGENRPLLDAPNGVHSFDDLIVLKTATMPAVLIEAGVIANPEEEIRLGESATQAMLARAIADGVVHCLKP
ncbi:MAG TPA: N-acetylmuramoyl-L-alanine amidase, partial [Rhizobacter sp.]|nr:N-acetylmuramoyl-L-alanine amidase [Rhizobacter sp.]